MKTQNLVVIFVIIILPISMILTSYTQNQIKTLNLQTSYDKKLSNATYDALKAFQLNTFNNTTSDLANSKMGDIEAAANVFFNSIASNFNMVGYNKETLKEYIPALVFTMYDGYYIYSLYENTLDDETQHKIDNNGDALIKGNGERTAGLKPYIYYSCRYKKDNIDVVITYSLDNYITVYGKDKNENPLNISGYVIDNISHDDESTHTIKYREVTIGPENPLKEYLGSPYKKNESTGVYESSYDNLYEYVKVNGIKYYKDKDPTNPKWFSLINGERYDQDKYKSEDNLSAYYYYSEALNFKTQLENAGLLELTPADALNEKGEYLKNTDDKKYDFSSTSKIFNYNNNIEEPGSNFNQHRLAVIRYSIEKNLSTAIANYNNYGGGVEANFQMPNLKESDWDKLLNNISIISFLQGLSIGGKIYNGYSIVTNNKNEEVVTEESIYITTNDDEEYHRATDSKLIDNPTVSNSNLGMGIFNIDVERRTINIKDPITDISTPEYYYPRKELACFNCLVVQNRNNSTDNIYKYMDQAQATGSVLPELYYTALGRERYSMYRINRNLIEIQLKYKETP